MVLKKALIIFTIIFVLTLLVPAFASFINIPSDSTKELATLFTGSISPFLNVHLFY